MKRFYKTATAERRPDGTAVVLLDGRTLRTPAKAELALPSMALAEAIAAEWQAQQDEIKPLQMPLTRLAATAIDRVVVDRAAATAEILRYGDTDLLSYRADGPQELIDRQIATWQPLLDWFRERYDVQLAVTQGVVAIPQASALRPRLERVCAGYDPFTLTAMHAATTTTGSVVIGLAILEGRLDAEAAHKAGLLDELYQAELWGEDAEASTRRANLLADLQSVHRFLSLLQAG